MGMTDAVNAQARAALSSVSFLKQKCREALVSHLPFQTHESVKLALLATPLPSLLFSDDIINEPLTQVKEDSQIKLLSNLSSQKGGEQSASTASSSGWTRGLCSSSLSSRYSSRSGRGGKHPYSSSPARRSKVSFDTSGLRSSTPKKSFFWK